MADVLHGSSDRIVADLKDALDQYERQHRGAKAALYRRNSASVRIRVIDRRFEGMARSERHDRVWKFLAARVPEDSLAEVSQLIALPPGEQADSFANLEFEKPTPSTL